MGAALLRALGEGLARPQDAAGASRPTLELEQVRQFSPEFALMFDFFEHEGTGIDLPGLHRRYPIGWHSFAQWAAGQNWKALQQPAA